MLFEEMQNETMLFEYLRDQFDTGEFPNAAAALPFAREKHFGQLRKPKELKIPYVVHPMLMARHALAMGLKDDALLAALLLHDVCEDCGVEPEELPVCQEARKLVRLVTKPGRGFSECAYYEAILKNPKACLIKCLDRCHNVSGMAVAFHPSRMREYIAETEEWYPRLLQAVKTVPEYTDAAWILSYQIGSVVQAADRINPR